MKKLAKLLDLFKTATYNWNNTFSPNQKDAVKVRLYFAICAVVVVFILLTAGCGTVSRVDPKLAEEFNRVITENRKVYNKIAKPFLTYVQNDVFVDEVVQADYILSVAVWESWLTRSEKFIAWLRSQGLLK